MKKKNKEKNKNFIIGIIVGILLTILILFFLIPHFQEPHFKIYKEECRNETPDENFLCADGSRGWLNPENKDVLKELNNCFYIPEREVCELVEVDEINLGKCKEGFEQADEPSGLSKDILMCYQETCEYIEEVDWSSCSSIYDFIVIQRISKQDLTIEWLDGNCECENYCDNPDFKEFNCKDNPCFLWKYEDYIIKRVG